eukprot:CAMPEP_0197697044 /NCGR_PEP_ID=MMETSP1338-20131121/117445_1 /TAXON_ID=43686 ORGANISM="Pelagodinium beii, Strain RCC1491" /NCGR_SAMPLE_ID=MMETSP1338 /ASSEMBLY_ACC=CAM_ASM_000754 /LENGTH=90 /DNA_ID=CAMNT_0043280245 /DNA_START=229 /DNA_END=499 /DNA_ORIENTATION=-
MTAEAITIAFFAAFLPLPFPLAPSDFALAPEDLPSSPDTSTGTWLFRTLGARTGANDPISRLQSGHEEHCWAQHSMQSEQKRWPQAVTCK